MFESYNSDLNLLERLGNRAAKLYGLIGESISWFYKSSLRVDLTEAFAAGMVAGFF